MCNNDGEYVAEVRMSMMGYERYRSMRLYVTLMCEKFCSSMGSRVFNGMVSKEEWYV